MLGLDAMCAELITAQTQQPFNVISFATRRSVQVGTAYLPHPEAISSAALQSEAARHTPLTNLFSGRPARGIVDRIMRELGPIRTAAPVFPWPRPPSHPCAPTQKPKPRR